MTWLSRLTSNNLLNAAGGGGVMGYRHIRQCCDGCMENCPHDDDDDDNDDDDDDDHDDDDNDVDDDDDDHGDGLM